jgi:RNA polymerase sigma factor (sigma-70 family)
MKTTLGDAVARLRHVAAVRTLDGLTDRELLGRFVESNDESAFAVLVERHGQMVLGVCRRLLPHHDAEDACQAAFLVLARKAASLRKVESLASWLHGVARRVAANARRDADLRKAREAGAAQAVAKRPAGDPTWSEVQLALDEELGRLPERYRAPLVLCYLECLTRDEAAARLGVSAGTLHGRLERGREMLRARLSKRGLSIPAVLTASALAEGALPPLLAVKTANAAALFAAGQPLSEVVGANVLALTKEVLMSMSMTKVKVATAAVLGVVLTAALGSFLPVVSAQDKQKDMELYLNQVKRARTEWYLFRLKPGQEKAETDEAFIRRVSNDLREKDPTPAEVHFFLASKEPGKRQKLIDLFIEERNAKKKAVTKEAPKQAEEQATVQTFILKHAAASEVAKALEKLVEKKGGRIVAEDRTNSVVVRAMKADMDGIRNLMAAWDALAEAEAKEKKGATVKKE